MGRGRREKAGDTKRRLVVIAFKGYLSIYLSPSFEYYLDFDHSVRVRNRIKSEIVQNKSLKTNRNKVDSLREGMTLELFEI